MKEDITHILAKHWQTDDQSKLDPAIVELFRSKLFATYELASEQVFFVMDHRSMKYLYVGENVRQVTGYDRDAFLENGIDLVAQAYHPDDVVRLGEASGKILNELYQLDEADILRCAMSFTFRFAFADGVYHQILQRAMPLTLGADKRIVHALLAVSDISPFKKDAAVVYKLIHYGENTPARTIIEGVAGESALRFTAREREVLALVADGRSDKEIASHFGLSIHTIKTHRKNLLRKSGAKNTNELVSFGHAQLLL